ncbi:g8232 [Coccomyxa viridis]|uniref:G8232 protein n=1 Tax=Coccomyxa viridis TaxID=1274662 RepID=A0ABP1G4P8_9CHLO
MGSCSHGANPWIEKYFKDCVYTYQDLSGFSLGMASILFWLVAQMPQIISNFRNQSAEALSPYFLAEWLLGDTCNLIGCLLTGNQLVTQVYTAMYFIFADIVLVVQFIYYTTLQRRKSRLKARKDRSRRSSQRSSRQSQRTSEQRGNSDDYRVSVHVEEPDLPNGAGHAEQAPLIGQQRVRLLACATCLLLVGWQAPGSSVGSFGREGRVLMHLENSPNSALGSSGQPGRMLRQSSAGDSTQRAVEIAEASSLESVLGHTEDAGQHWTRQVLGGEEQLQRTLGGHHKLPKWVRLLGVVLGWASSVFYLGSRVSQICKNISRRSAEGLSLAMFGPGSAASSGAMLMSPRTLRSQNILAKWLQPPAVKLP